MGNSKNDVAWEKIFAKFDIIQKVNQNGQINISSTEINEFREARLMTKFDHRSQLPSLFSENNLSILPISRGGYLIGTFETFHEFNKDEIEVSKINFPTFLESLDFREINSEATAINCAFVSKILHDFTEEDNLLPTVSGRMSSATFDFNINSSITGIYKINVKNAQVEIDGGYEGDFSLNLIEAKNYISNDFLVRQLYFPFKLWNKKIKKTVRPIFLSYTNGTFHLREYAFENIDNYNSLKLIHQKKYAVQDGSINIETIEDVLYNVKIVKEPDLPFPQADNFDRVINLCELLNRKIFISKEEITQNYDFDLRQTDYYTNAGKYLGLISNANEDGQKGCTLSANGKHLFSKTLSERQREFIKLILSHSAFNDALKLYFEDGIVPTKQKIVALMKRSELFRIVSDETYSRRASTIKGWVNWILCQIEE